MRETKSDDAALEREAIMHEPPVTPHPAADRTLTADEQVAALMAAGMSRAGALRVVARRQGSTHSDAA